MNEGLKKDKVFVVDYVVQDLLCNLGCLYCLGPRRQKTNVDTAEVTDNAVLQLEKIKRLFDPAVIKISGGEIACLGDGCIRVCRKASEIFDRVQVLTNGVDFKSSWLDELGKLDNITFQISLDGHTLAMNKLRFDEKHILERILRLVKEASQISKIEINTVISKENEDGLVDFIEYIAEISNNIVVYPFPIRGILRFFPSAAAVKRLVDKTDCSSDIAACLPPQSYLQNLLTFCEAKQRTKPCYVPMFVRGIWDSRYDPQLKKTINGCFADLCPCEPLLNFDNIEKNKGRFIIPKELKEKIINGFLEGPCSMCFTHYDIFNCLVEKSISVKEIANLPILQTLDNSLDMFINEYCDND